MKKILVTCAAMLLLCQACGQNATVDETDPHGWGSWHPVPEAVECYDSGGMWLDNICTQLPEHEVSGTFEYSEIETGTPAGRETDLVATADCGGHITFTTDRFTIEMTLPNFETNENDASKTEILACDLEENRCAYGDLVNISGTVNILSVLDNSETIGCVSNKYYTGYANGNIDMDGTIRLRKTTEEPSPTTYTIDLRSDFTLKIECGCIVD